MEGADGGSPQPEGITMDGGMDESGMSPEAVAAMEQQLQMEGGESPGGDQILMMQ